MYKTAMFPLLNRCERSALDDSDWSARVAATLPLHTRAQVPQWWSSSPIMTFSAHPILILRGSFTSHYSRDLFLSSYELLLFASYFWLVKFHWKSVFFCSFLMFLLSILPYLFKLAAFVSYFISILCLMK